MSAPRLSTTEKQAVVADYKAGARLTDIAAKYNIDPSYPSLLALRRGIPRRVNSSSTMIEDILAAVTAEWSSAREIWLRMGMWSVTATRERLAWLVESGEVERIGRPMFYRYRRSPPSEPMPSG